MNCDDKIEMFEECVWGDNLSCGVREMVVTRSFESVKLSIKEIGKVLNKGLKLLVKDLHDFEIRESDICYDFVDETFDFYAKGIGYREMTKEEKRATAEEEEVIEKSKKKETCDIIENLIASHPELILEAAEKIVSK